MLLICMYCILSGINCFYGWWSFILTPLKGVKKLRLGIHLRSNYFCWGWKWSLEPWTTLGKYWSSNGLSDTCMKIIRLLQIRISNEGLRIYLCFVAHGLVFAPIILILILTILRYSCEHNCLEHRSSLVILYHFVSEPQSVNKKNGNHLRYYHNPIDHPCWSCAKATSCGLILSRSW